MKGEMWKYCGVKTREEKAMFYIYVDVDIIIFWKEDYNCVYVNV